MYEANPKKKTKSIYKVCIGILSKSNLDTVVFSSNGGGQIIHMRSMLSVT